ncbi:unnamed protein product [Spirodela intermedia]|uniref:[RNA-polymerase]-subunit kinase n=1 Tax=Spirodela intermedia TaxID=51605 RepID=A0A7I8IYI7_SPIIN|nr:unnamed protein product [Spirodela intermedia]CAA6662072.1 unnamed protein product [Spirodela intermedia]
MGCVFGREARPRSAAAAAVPAPVAEGKDEDDLSSLSISKSQSTFCNAEGGVVALESSRVEAEEEDEVGSGRAGVNGGSDSLPQRQRKKPNPRLSNPAKHVQGEQVAAGWPGWLAEVAGEAIKGWIPRRADTFQKLDKIGQGTYSNVYKARDTFNGKIVALKKVRFDNLERESVRFMAREILILRRLDHPNVVKLEGLVTSRMSCSLYLVFEYMEHDLAGLAATPGIKFTEPQVKCYMHQLLSGLEHCHRRGVLHRDIKGSNLLLDNSGVLKIADFGLASLFDPEHKQPMTSRLLLGATHYGVGVDLWSAGCILAELLAGKPIMPGRNEVEQLHRIFKLCGSPSEEYWKKSKLPHATIFKPQKPYKRCIAETFKDFHHLLLMAQQFFTTEPYACEPSSLPKYPPSKEMDAKIRDEEARRVRAPSGRFNADGAKKTRPRDRAPRAMPAPEANAELQVNIDRRRLVTHSNAKSKSEKFPPPHQDGALGFPWALPAMGTTPDSTWGTPPSPASCPSGAPARRRSLPTPAA